MYVLLGEVIILITDPKFPLNLWDKFLPQAGIILNLMRNIANEIDSCTYVAYVNKTLRSELKIIQEILSHPLRCNLETPIAHIVPRDPDFITYGDT